MHGVSKALGVGSVTALCAMALWMSYSIPGPGYGYLLTWSAVLAWGIGGMILVVGTVAGWRSTSFLVARGVFAISLVTGLLWTIGIGPNAAAACLHEHYVPEDRVHWCPPPSRDALCRTVFPGLDRGPDDAVSCSAFWSSLPVCPSDETPVPSQSWLSLRDRNLDESRYFRTRSYPSLPCRMPASLP